MKNNNKQAFIIVEIAVMIAIISILSIISLTAQVLINNTKIIKIQEEYRMFNNSVKIFYDKYDCIPGDCSIKKILDISSLIPINCTLKDPPGQAYLAFDTGAIDSIIKRSCMMYIMQSSGYIGMQSLSRPNIEASTFVLGGSVAGVNIPYTAFSKQAAWNFRTPVYKVNSTDANIVTLPLEIGIGELSSWTSNTSPNGNGILVLQSSESKDDITVSTPKTNGGPSYGISSSLAAKVDMKFDDGRPYSGNIIGGLNSTDFNASNSNKHCNTLADKTADAINSSPIYLQNKDLTTGCLLTFNVTFK